MEHMAVRVLPIFVVANADSYARGCCRTCTAPLVDSEGDDSSEEEVRFQREQSAHTAAEEAHFDAPLPILETPKSSSTGSSSSPDEH